MTVDEIKMEALTASEPAWATIINKVAKKYKRVPRYEVDNFIEQLNDLRNPNNVWWYNRRVNDLIGAILDARN